MKIYYEDENIIVCEKHFGISSQKDGKENMISLLEEKFGGEIYPVHRLDVQTTGLMVYARKSQAAGALSKQIAEGVFVKQYLCVCHGRLEDEGEMTDFLYHDRLKNKTFVVKAKRAGVKEARLAFKTVSYSEDKDLSLLQIRLYTGRTHQIRAQLSSRGHALYGDGKYGARDNDRIALHSSYLSFNHPITKRQLEFSSFPEGRIWDEMKKR